MSEYAPQEIEWLAAQIVAAIPTAELSGIVGDVAHTYGYHRARNLLPESDYSVSDTPEDKKGDGWAASALDISYSPAWMKTVTYRLKKSADDLNDPRLNHIREFAGTLNGSVVYSDDTYFQISAYGEWDDSHLWHVHMSFLREYAEDMATMRDVLSVVLGQPYSPAPVETSVEDDDMVLVHVDDKHLPSGEKWPGNFVLFSNGILHHVEDDATWKSLQTALKTVTFTWNDYQHTIGAMA